MRWRRKRGRGWGGGGLRRMKLTELNKVIFNPLSELSPASSSSCSQNFVA